MSDRTSREHPPLVVIANSQEWHTRSLESILGPHGYAVLRAYTGKQALERCRSGKPDIIIIDTDLTDIDGLEICRTLRDDPLISHSTPILVTSPGHPSRQKRLAALRAGAWDFLGSALDGEELPLRLDAYVRAKFDADRARAESPVDQLTGLYNVRGLARRPGSSEFEDHLSVEFETMRMLVAGEAGRRPATIAEQRAFCETHLLPWAFDCCAAISTSLLANYYRQVALFASCFVALERDSFAIE
jgi:DNA-binding response OmpR family regulator